MRMRLLSLVAILLFLASCQCGVKKYSTLQIMTKGGPALFNVEVARTHEDREHGLMNRTSMASDAGMIFIFDGQVEHPFWMKNTLIPLDIIFFDNDWKVVGVIENLEPMSRQSRSIGKPSRYALEVNGGVAAKVGIAEGDTGVFTEFKKP